MSCFEKRIGRSRACWNLVVIIFVIDEFPGLRRGLRFVAKAEH
jgi:hypothetical protein